MSAKSTLWRRKKRAEALGCSVEDLPDNRGRHHNGPHGMSHHRWNGNLTNRQGYKLVRVGRKHPLACPNGYALEHVLVWVAAHGVESLNGKILHHKNGEKQDNRLENLEALTQAKHNALHNSERGRDALGRFRSRFLDNREHSELPEVTHGIP